MERPHNLVLQGTETFSRGALDNAALENGCIVLDGVADGFLPYGCYTTPELALPRFDRLQVSWNADVPPNTLVHAQCRVFAGGHWSGWLSFGKWAADRPHCSVYAENEEKTVFMQGDTVWVKNGATAVQMRISLTTNDPRVTPAVRLLAAAAHPMEWEKQKGRPINRVMYLPGYAMPDHDSRFGAQMDLPLTMAALMNRVGEDILPEELAYSMRDTALGGCSNVAYAAAAAGNCGYACWQSWMDLKDLRRQIHDGCPPAVLMSRSGMYGHEEPESVWMGLCGFDHDPSVGLEDVRLMDPSGPSDGTAEITLALEDFLRYYTGRALVMQRKPRGQLFSWPNRVRCDVELARDGKSCHFTHRGGIEPLPEDFSGWAACALKETTVHATTAHRTFYPLTITPTGGMAFSEEALAVGGHCSIYVVDELGVMRVAELRLPKPRPAPEQESKGDAPSGTAAGAGAP